MTRDAIQALVLEKCQAEFKDAKVTQSLVWRIKAFVLSILQELEKQDEVARIHPEAIQVTNQGGFVNIDIPHHAFRLPSYWSAS